MQRSWLAAAGGGLVLALAACQPLETQSGNVQMQPLPPGKVLAITSAAGANPDMVAVWIEGADGSITLVSYDHWRGTVARSVTVPRR
jgi:hypothetical protein